MIAGRTTPVFPRRIAAWPVPTRHLAALIQRAVPVLRAFERVSHPRWPTPPAATRRIVGSVVAILSTSLLVIPIPFSNIVPAAVIVMISLAYLEGDGLLLLIGSLAAFIVMAAEFAAIWATIRGAQWIVGLW